MILDIGVVIQFEFSCSHAKLITDKLLLQRSLSLGDRSALYIWTYFWYFSCVSSAHRSAKCLRANVWVYTSSTFKFTLSAFFWAFVFPSTFKLLFPLPRVEWSMDSGNSVCPMPITSNLSVYRETDFFCVCVSPLFVVFSRSHIVIMIPHNIHNSKKITKCCGAAIFVQTWKQIRQIIFSLEKIILPRRRQATKLDIRITLNFHRHTSVQMDRKKWLSILERFWAMSIKKNYSFSFSISQVGKTVQVFLLSWFDHLFIDSHCIFRECIHTHTSTQSINEL